MGVGGELEGLGREKSPYFRSYSPVNDRRCGNIYYIFGHVRMLTFVVVNFSVKFNFSSYSFGHLDSVK